MFKIKALTSLILPIAILAVTAIWLFKGEPSTAPVPVYDHKPPGFDAVFPLTGLMAVAILVLRQDKKR